MFAKTASLDRIVDRGRVLLLASVGRHLAVPATVPARPVRAGA
jgi:hypothetical protein